MASIFDGVAHTLNALFGDQVRYTAAGRPARPVQSMFREELADAEDDSGRAVIIGIPTWKVRGGLVPELARGDRIEPGNGRVYAITNFRPSASPDAEAFVLCELERIFP
jgi:hypothetical protein